MRQAIQCVRSIKAHDLPKEVKGPDIGEMLISYRIKALEVLKAKFLAEQEAK